MRCAPIFRPKRSRRGKTVDAVTDENKPTANERRWPRWVHKTARDYLCFAGVYFFLALVQLRAKLYATPAWFSGQLGRNHRQLLDFSYTNNEQSRLFQFLIPELFRRVFDLSIPDAYILQRWLFVFLAFLLFHRFMRNWFSHLEALCGVCLLAAVMPLTYRNHLQESASLLMLLFVITLDAIYHERRAAYAGLLLAGAFGNETLLSLGALWFLRRLKSLSFKSFVRTGVETALLSLPGFVALGIIRYINRDNPHLGQPLQFFHNIDRLVASAKLPLLHWHDAFGLHFIFIYGFLWLFALLAYRKAPFFFKRSVIFLPFFLIPHWITGITSEPRQMIPLAFVVIPMSMFWIKDRMPPQTA